MALKSFNIKMLEKNVNQRMISLQVECFLGPMYIIIFNAVFRHGNCFHSFILKILEVEEASEGGVINLNVKKVNLLFVRRVLVQKDIFYLLLKEMELCTFFQVVW